MRFTGIVHHGTDVLFEQFDPTKIGTQTDEGQLGRGFYFSTDPAISRGDQFHVTARVDLKTPLRLRLPSWTTSKGRLVKQALGVPHDASADEITDALVAAEFDGVVLDYTPTGYRHQEILVLGPENIQILGTERSLKRALMPPH